VLQQLGIRNLVLDFLDKFSLIERGKLGNYTR
jgi:hypothetical protein